MSPRKTKLFIPLAYRRQRSGTLAVW